MARTSPPMPRLGNGSSVWVWDPAASFTNFAFPASTTHTAPAASTTRPACANCGSTIWMEVRDIHVSVGVDRHVLWVFQTGERQHGLCGRRRWVVRRSRRCRCLRRLRWPIASADADGGDHEQRQCCDETAHHPAANFTTRPKPLLSMTYTLPAPSTARSSGA